MLTQLCLRGRVLVVLALFAVLGAAALWEPCAAIAGATVEVKNTATQVIHTPTTYAQALLLQDAAVALGTYRIG
jgi:hypothetical protein